MPRILLNMVKKDVEGDGGWAMMSRFWLDIERGWWPEILIFLVFFIKKLMTKL